ncbi:MAG: M20/M25/M40 family metallo-hydrolase [Chitinophagaceae bacterium]|nr:M20/M25/M40 family metallo-hydrolase [Chitinophagaceae bacterium]
MISSLVKYLLPLCLIVACSSPKKTTVTKSSLNIVDSLKAHITYLADDKLEGRRTGTNGEKLAVEYITTKFIEIGLEPKGTEYYSQSFIVHDGKKIDSVTAFSINGNVLALGKDFFPFPYSPAIKLEALPAIAVQEAEMPWFFDLKETLEENKNNPHFDLPDYVYKNATKAKDRGAAAVILYNSSAIDDKLVFNEKDKAESLSIPVLYVSKEIAKKYFDDATASLDVKLRISISEKNRLGHNVVGYINNNAATTVILGAHFDHLGYGEDGNSMIRSGPMSIHNGADDNASGTAALIELARKLKNSGAKNNNYLFIAFSGEELGLFGSKYFVENPTVDLKNVNYMINMDMVGRLNDSTEAITVGGYGTSPSWGEYYTSYQLQGRKLELQIKVDSSGSGPSDHTSFYRKDIPVLFYFTGLHSDYHKPSDDADKINYKGELKIIDHIYNLVETFDKREKTTFTKTRETQTTTSARFSVSMGIMPDYTFSGSGVRADGVSDGKPAIKAGLKAGDIIIKMGEHNIASLENYMQALGKFKKGDRVKVKYKRADKELETTVEF